MSKLQPKQQHTWTPKLYLWKQMHTIWFPVDSSSLSEHGLTSRNVSSSDIDSPSMPITRYSCATTKKQINFLMVWVCSYQIKVKNSNLHTIMLKHIHDTGVRKSVMNKWNLPKLSAFFTSHVSNAVWSYDWAKPESCHTHITNITAAERNVMKEVYRRC
jgi:hypothetical protein